MQVKTAPFKSTTDTTYSDGRRLVSGSVSESRAIHSVDLPSRHAEAQSFGVMFDVILFRRRLLAASLAASSFSSQFLLQTSELGDLRLVVAHILLQRVDQLEQLVLAHLGCGVQRRFGVGLAGVLRGEHERLAVCRSVVVGDGRNGLVSGPAQAGALGWLEQLRGLVARAGPLALEHGAG